MLKEALAGLPTRPAVYLSVTVLVLGLAYHFATTYRSCREHAALREALSAAIASSAARGSVLRLGQLTDFSWDRAEILVNYKPGGPSTDCPLQWDWSRKDREKLIAGDLLTVIVFLLDSKLVGYLETRGDRVRFVDVKNPYSPETAVFRAARSRNNPQQYVVTPAL